MHLSSNSTHKWPLPAQVMSAVARGYCRSHTTYQFLTSFGWAKLQRWWWKFKAWLSHRLCAPGAQTVGNASELQHISSMNTVIHSSQDCSGENAALEQENCLFSGKKFWQNQQAREACLLFWHARGKDPALQHPGEIKNWSPGVWWTLSRDQLLCPFPSWSKHFRLGINLTWNRGLPKVWKKTCLN